MKHTLMITAALATLSAAIAVPLSVKKNKYIYKAKH